MDWMILDIIQAVVRSGVYVLQSFPYKDVQWYISFRSKIIGGDPSSTWIPLPPTPPPPTSKYYQNHSRRSGSLSAGAPGWAESGAACQALVGSRRRRAVSEGSLLPTVAGNLVTEQSQRGGKGRGEQERAGKGGGGGSGRFARGNQEGIE